MHLEGSIHSIETCGTVDGPGIRYVIFFQGCPLRCQYCHNPDTWALNQGKTKTVEELITDIKKYKSYINFSRGGVTATGGEPLVQYQFVESLFKQCRKEGIHTALDTSGYIFNDKIKEVLEYTDLVLLDIKCMNPEQYKYITAVKLDPTIAFMNYLGEINKPVWVRYVLVPGLSDNPDHIHALGHYLSQFSNMERFELLPFHKMGEYKWEELGYDYKLKQTMEPTQQEIDAATAILESYKIDVN